MQCWQSIQLRLIGLAVAEQLKFSMQALSDSIEYICTIQKKLFMYVVIYSRTLHLVQSAVFCIVLLYINIVYSIFSC